MAVVGPADDVELLMVDEPNDRDQDKAQTVIVKFVALADQQLRERD